LSERQILYFVALPLIIAFCWFICRGGDLSDHPYKIKTGFDKFNAGATEIILILFAVFYIIGAGFVMSI